MTFILLFVCPKISKNKVQTLLLVCVASYSASETFGLFL
uniref:Uncharacterized protein n=1 Tax=Rhizophora mucronata TaxID=61149 RepID=A0A2P2NTA8_RHIMU